jgi:RND superfamily putative drug exporter
MPIILMGVLFGLAMDYEVFLVSRMREDYVHHRDAHGAIESGFLGSARVVTAAALIMFAVFAAFVPSGDAAIQPIALGLAVGVTIDAFVVRMTLIPAVLTLFGRHAWWMPRALDRLLPHFDVEGESITRELELAVWPPPPARADLAIAAEGVTLSRGDLVLVADFSARVPRGDALVLRADGRAAAAALAAAICGRHAVASGRLKCLGLVLPARAPWVRGRTALVTLGGSREPADDIRVALTGSVEVLVLCDLDEVGATRARAAVVDVLRRAADVVDHSSASASGRARGRDSAAHAAFDRAPLTVVVTCGLEADVSDMLAPFVTQEVRVDGGPETVRSAGAGAGAGAGASAGAGAVDEVHADAGVG